MSYDYKRIGTKKHTTHVCDVRSSVDNITNKLDRQAVANFELNLQVNKYKSELVHALEQLEEHTYCPGEVQIQCNPNHCADTCKHQEPVAGNEPVHGADCHCSKCCPNPNPNFFKKHKLGILVSILWSALIILGIGWTPSGPVFDAIQNSWVQLFVNFFKVGIFAIAGIVSYQLLKHNE